MAKGVIFSLFVIIILGVAMLTLYENIPRDPITLTEDEIIPDEIALINYGLTPVFSENLRFNHNEISYFIDSSCSEKREDSMKLAFKIFEEEMEIISFYEAVGNVDIEVGCSDDYISVGENLFAAGEGGPSRIVNTSNFKTIEKGKISLYEDQRCDYPIVELHELLHVFGFDHSENPSSIMYNVSKCKQRITDDMVEIIKELYVIKPLSDLAIENLTAVKRGKYLDFKITVLNEGLIDVEKVNLTILSKNKIVQVIDMDELGIGYGRTLEAKNIRLPSLKTEEIIFSVDHENSIEELNEFNNLKKMSIS